MSTSARAPNRRPADGSDMLEIDTIDGLKALADPLRMRLLMEVASGRRTVKALAESLGVPKTRLYYHVNLLERHGLIRVASRRIVSGIEERSYEAPLNGWTIVPTLLLDAIGEGLVEAVFDLACAELEVALEDETTREQVFEPGDPLSNVPILNLTSIWLNPDEVDEFMKRFGELVQRFNRYEQEPGTEEYHGLFTLYRTQLRQRETEPTDAS